MTVVWFTVLLGLIFCAVCTGMLPPPPDLIPVCPPFDSSVCRYAKPGRPECYNDSQCTDSKKCCCSPTCGLRCLDPDIVKAGHCPNIQAKCMTEVTDKCDNDIDCPGSQKCCNICGKNCWDPEPEPFMVCPRNDDDPSVSLQCNLGTCTRDSDCKIGEKCCPSENGPSCVKFIKDVTYVCPAFNSSICHLARPGPNECQDDSQCTDSKKCCCSSNCGLKCVVPEKVKAGLCPIQRIMCLIRPTFTCKSDCDCPGSEKCCNICGKNCFEAVQVKPGICPNIKAECPANFISNCERDIDCPRRQKCCNICGLQCLNPEPEPIMICPRNDKGHPSSLQCSCVNCSRDSDCQRGDKCCASGNGLSCVKPITVKPFNCPSSSSAIQCKKDTNTCENDGDCTEDRKCCPVCGMNCWKPEPE